MKIIIDNKIQNINFWSYLRLHVTAQLVLLGIVYGLIFLLYLLIV